MLSIVFKLDEGEFLNQHDVTVKGILSAIVLWCEILIRDKPERVWDLLLLKFPFEVLGQVRI